MGMETDYYIENILNFPSETMDYIHFFLCFLLRLRTWYELTRETCFVSPDVCF